MLGAGGQVGRAVIRMMSGRHEIIAKARAELDIADAAEVDRVMAAARPDWVVNAAAYTAVDLAEDEPARAAAINDAAVGILADATAHVHGRLLHLSTDFVFDGSSNRAYLPGDAAHPLSVYGATKLAGERRALAGGAAAIVLRTAWVYASAGKNFVLTMLRLMRERDQVKVVGDQIGAPTWATGLGEVIRDLLEARATAGIYHWTDLGVASWYDFAVAIQDEALARGLLQRAAFRSYPSRPREYPTRAHAPGIQRARYRRATRARGGDAGAALATQFKDDAR